MVDSGSKDTRQKILQCSISLIKEKGYSKTSVNQIIAEAGVAKGTFFYYFKTKDEVILDIIDLHIDQSVQFLTSIGFYTSPSLNSLKTGLAHILSTIPDSQYLMGAFIKVLLKQVYTTDDNVHDTYINKYINLIYPAFEHEQISGIIRGDVSAQEMASSTAQVIIGALVMWASTKTNEPLVDYILPRVELLLDSMLIHYV